jgi:hypothetical protein
MFCKILLHFLKWSGLSRQKTDLLKVDPPSVIACVLNAFHSQTGLLIEAA